MKNTNVRWALHSALVPILAAGIALSSAAAGGAPAPNRGYGRVVLPSGTVIPVTLDAPLSSKDSQKGDKFSATVRSGNDDGGLPEGTRIEGVIREAYATGDGKPGVLDMKFNRIILPSGAPQAITASLYSLDGKAVKRSDGRLIAREGRGKDTLKWVGIGAGAGLVLSQVVKGNVLVDTLLGAGAGYLYSELQGKKKPNDVDLKEGAEFGVRLDRQLAFNTDDRQYYRDNRKTSSEGFNNDRDRGLDTVNGNDIRVTVDDRSVRFDNTNRPYMRNGTVYVPLGAVGKAGNLDYRYEPVSRVIYARNDAVRLNLDSRTARVDGERRSLPAAAELQRGLIFVPMQFIGWAANGEADWDADTRTVAVTTERDRR
jgi:hypothetical protein